MSSPYTNVYGELIIENLYIIIHIDLIYYIEVIFMFVLNTTITCFYFKIILI